MDLLIEIALVVLILMGAALLYYAIVALRKLTDSLSAMQNDISLLVKETLPVLENLKESTDRLNSLASSLEKKIDQIESFSDSVKDKVTSFFAFKDSISPVNPILRLVSNLGALQKGVAAFWTKFKEN